MANRARGRAPQFKPPATQEQLDTLIEQFNAALGALASRLNVTEFAVSQLIQDVYAEQEEPCEDCDKDGTDDFVPGDTEDSAEKRRQHLEELPQAAGLDALPGSDEPDTDVDIEEFARLEADRLRAEAMALAEFENEGGSYRD